MIVPDEEWHLDTHWLGQRVWVCDRIDSTNRAALELAGDSRNDGLVLIARQQTAGRGQHGRTWLAAPNTSVLMSLLIFPPPELRRPSLLTAWVAVSVCELVEQHTQQSARIKWPNDVLVADRKICGILIEQQQGTVVGIGLNVRQTTADFDRAGLPDATSLIHFTRQPLDPKILAYELVHRLDLEYTALLKGEFELLQSRWKACLRLLDAKVIVECAQEKIRGRLLDATFAGLLLDVDGTPRTVIPELVRHLTLV